MVRPTKLTPEVADGIVELIQKCVHPPIAAGAYGVSDSTYHEWLARGEARDPLRPADPVFIEFAARVRDAEFQAEAALVALATAKVKTTQDALAILERRYGDRWRQRREVEINIRRLAEKVADGMDPAAVVAEAERILAEAV